MSIEIRLGTASDIDMVAQLYDDATDYLERNTNYPGWRKGDYPARQDAAQGIADENLFVAWDASRVVGSIILRQGPEPAYLGASWQAELTDCQVLVIHTFVVSPHEQKRGIGKLLLDFATQYASERGIKALRLDVYEKNLPAVRLYEKCGYSYIGVVSLGLEQYGLDWFRLYEKLV